MTKEQLKNRWSGKTKELDEILTQACTEWNTDKALFTEMQELLTPIEGCDEVEYKLDLRGCVIENRTLDNMDLADFDLSHAVFKNCRINKTNLQPLPSEDVKFENCHFFDGFFLGQFKNTCFINCTFEELSWIGNIFYNSEVTDCTFTNSRVGNIVMFNTTIRNIKSVNTEWSILFEAQHRRYFRSKYPESVSESFELSNSSFEGGKLNMVGIWESLVLENNKMPEKHHVSENW